MHTVWYAYVQNTFLGATKHLYNWLCLLVGWLVGWLVGNTFVRRSTCHTCWLTWPCSHRMLSWGIHQYIIDLIILQIASWLSQSWVVILSWYDIQLNPALTDFRGPTIFFCYRWISVIANKGIKSNQLEGTMKLHLL